MSLRRWAPIVLRPLLRFPYAASALSVYLVGFFWETASPSWRTVLSLSLLSLGGLAYLAVPRPPAGQRARRRLFEGAFALLACVDFLGEAPGLWWLHYAAFPLFLAWVYAGYRYRELILLLSIHAAVQFFGHRAAPEFLSRTILPLLLLGFWLVFAVFYRAQEKKRHRGVSDRLRLYEQEATALERRAEGVQPALRSDERKKVHLANTIRDRERSFQLLLEVLQKTFNPHTAALYLFDPVKDAFLLKEHVTASDRFSASPEQSLSGIFLAAAREKAPVRLVSATGELRGLTYYDGIPRVRSVLAVPVGSQNLLKGLLIVDRLEAMAFSDAETETAELIAEQAALVMDHSASLHAYFDLMEEVSNFYAAASALNRCLRVEDVLRTLLDSTRAIAHYDWGAVILHDAVSDSNRISLEQGEGEGALSERTFACAPERGLVSWVVKNRMPLHYTAFRSRNGKTPLFPKQIRMPDAYESILAVPLHWKGESLGALLLAARQDGRFPKSVRKMVEVTALQASASLKNARMVDQLERLATTDGLTGLLNHRTFQETLVAEIERTGRHPAPVSLLLVDIDFFKKFNDEYGHPTGDFVLREIAQVLRRAVRKVDAVARYGGEEFAVILVNTPRPGALQMAERIVAEVRRSRFQHESLTLHVTLSVGAATLPGDAVTREELIECADRALYEAKHRGRNRAMLFEASMGKMSAARAEERLVAATEEELRHAIDQSGPTV